MRKIRIFLVLLTAIVILLPGCVRRRMTVRSNPPGATVYLDGKEIGKTPFSANFDHYGKREFRLVKEGYETKTVLLPVRAPWYQWIGIDFVSEVLLPGKLTDHKYYEFDMQPDRIVPSYELVGRADELRRLAHAEGTLSVNDKGAVSIQSGPVGGSLSYQENPSGASVYQEPVAAPVLPPPASTPSSDPGNYVPPLRY